MAFQQYPGSGQFPGQQFPGQQFPPQAPKLGPGVLGVIAAVLGLLIGLVALSMPVTVVAQLPSGISLGDVKGSALVALGLYTFAGLVMVAGALTAFMRQVGGLCTLMAGAVIATAMPLLEPVFYGGRYGKFLQYSFEFKLVTAYVTVLCLTVAPIVLILAAVALAIRGPRRRRRDGRAAMATGGYPQQYPPQQYPPQQYPQQQYPPQPPQQGGFPPQQW